jgi:hypothetical protein
VSVREFRVQILVQLLLLGQTQRAICFQHALNKPDTRTSFIDIAPKFIRVVTVGVCPFLLPPLQVFLRVFQPFERVHILHGVIVTGPHTSDKFTDIALPRIYPILKVKQQPVAASRLTCKLNPWRNE